MKKQLILIKILLVSFSSFCQNNEQQNKNIIGLYYISLGEGWSHQGDVEVIPSLDHYVFIELKADSNYIRTIIQEFLPQNYYEIGKWKQDGDTILLTTQQEKNTTKYILKSQSNDQYYLAEMNTSYNYSKTQKEYWPYDEITKLTVYEGTAINENDSALFIPDFADSTSYKLEVIKKWDKKYLNKKLKIYGILSGDILKNWTIIE